MSVFQDIIKGMADGAEALQANFAKLAKAISAIDDDGTIHFRSVSADNLAVNGHALIETLWSGSINWNQTATLSKPKSEYDYLIVQTSTLGNQQTTWIASNLNEFRLVSQNLSDSNSQAYMYETIASLTGTTLSVTSSRFVTITGTSTNSVVQNDTDTKITAVLGVSVA